ncbi:hypothetical protein PSJM300_13545 [Stutzerimonas stutzeri DSM 10701]|uniref:hypothetical protein n=1 Tax=Stutzerimonas nitrititolerans TaxID=2482751 RepID=UPI00026D6630|nr:hypothetical protein [Stutzerimonas nitrititolerans]AFN78771.1 hypothetical protein PSJM300_13545 [Stutzerimonas stutzeri DSM 10701]KRW69133.1 hypothetical protein AO729_04830 [Pseudomonas sp. TTU2014-066ASC]SUD85296.1 Uncharacterised protein [Stutzerimonas stutzeri]
MDIKRFEKTRLSYEAVPIYRKRWFVLLTLLLCLPVTIIIALTGDVYAKKDGTVYKFKDGALLHLAFMAMTFLIVGLFLAAKR